MTLQFLVIDQLASLEFTFVVSVTFLFLFVIFFAFHCCLVLIRRSCAFFATGFKEFRESFQCSFARIVDSLARTSRELFDRWERMYFDIFQFVSGSVHFRDDDIFVVFEFLAQLIPNWCQLFAMTTPWSIEFHQNVLLRFLDHFIEIFRDQIFNWFLVPIIRNFLRQQMRLQFLFQIIGGEFDNIFESDIFPFWFVFCHVFFQ